MKKYLFIIMAALLLVACGGKEDEASKEDADDFDEEQFEEDFGDELDEMFSEDEVELEEGMTDEVSEIMPMSSEYDTFVAKVDEYNTYIFDVKARYTNSDSFDEGINNIDMMRRDQVDADDEMFNYNFSLMAAENREDGQNYLLFAGEVVNNTSKRVQFNHDFDVIMRDIKEEDSTYGGNAIEDGLIDAYEPEFDSEGWYAFPIESEEIPEKLEFKFERAWDENGAGGSGEDDEYLEIEFTKE